jgi:dTDP-4-amino-4,6-dideoxygalactose transaminase
MVPFVDLKIVHAHLASEIDQSIRRVVERGWFILGPEVEAFERAFAEYHGVNHAVGVANGTDAIELALRAGGIGPGDEVITVAHTAVATVCAIERTGARPVLVDIDPRSYTMDPSAAAAAITSRTRAIVPVHLYGHPAEITAIAALAERHQLLLVEDCAQAHGARFNDKLVGAYGHMAAFSFYPTKNLGACGDGGAVITHDAHYSAKLRRLRNYGQVTRYVHVERGVNSRLDEVQAAILCVKLKHLDRFNQNRREIAAEYNRQLQGVTLPWAHPLAYHVYHLYVIRHPKRDQLAETLKSLGIGTLIHYPIPNHLQEGYRDLGYVAGSLPVTERVAKEILSLPLYFGLTPEDIRVVADGVAKSLEILGD